MHYKKIKNSDLSAVATILMLATGSVSAIELDINDMKASVYGYAKLDMIYDFDAYIGPTVTHRLIPLDGREGAEGHTNFHAFQSRLGFKTSTTVGGSALNTTVEGDFFGGGGGQLRLRHAYGEWNGVLAGQTWTNFGGFLGFTPVVDFTAQFGQANITRQAQLRYTSGGFSVALEEPGNIGSNVDIANSPNVGDHLKSSFPDLTIRYGDRLGEINYGVSAVLREIAYHNSGAKNDESALGWGMNIEALSKVTETITVRGAITHGDGLGGYLYGSQGAAGFIDNSGSVQGIKGTGGTVGMTISAGSGNVNVAYGIATVDLDDAVAQGAMSPQATDRAESVYLNYIWSPASRINYGIELGYHSRGTQSGEEGDAVRLQAMLQYTF